MRSGLRLWRRDEGPDSFARRRWLQVSEGRTQCMHAAASPAQPASERPAERTGTARVAPAAVSLRTPPSVSMTSAIEAGSAPAA